MGDRTNTVFRMADGSDVVLYQHWGGDGMLDSLAGALAVARPRWSDEAYATRIMISHLIGSDWSQELGYGIATYIMDNEHSVPVIQFHDQTVELYGYEWDKDYGKCNLVGQKFKMSFDSFVKKFSKTLTTV